MKTTPSKRIPNRLRKYRLEAGLPAELVANIIGLSSTDRLIRWEKGLALPSVENLFRLRVLYKRSCEQLFLDLFQDLKDETTTRMNEHFATI